MYPENEFALNKSSNNLNENNGEGEDDEAGYETEKTKGSKRDGIDDKK